MRIHFWENIYDMLGLRAHLNAYLLCLIETVIWKMIWCRYNILNRTWNNTKHIKNKSQYIKAYYVQNHVNIATSQNIYIIVIQTICSEHDINLLRIVTTKSAQKIRIIAIYLVDINNGNDILLRVKERE